MFQSPSELMKGVALGTKSLVSNTVYAVSNATTQFSKAAHKVCWMFKRIVNWYYIIFFIFFLSFFIKSVVWLQGIVAFTFDEHDAAKQREKLDTHNRGFLNELLEVWIFLSACWFLAWLLNALEILQFHKLGLGSMAIFSFVDMF